MQEDQLPEAAGGMHLTARPGGVCGVVAFYIGTLGAHAVEESTDFVVLFNSDIDRLQRNDCDTAPLIIFDLGERLPLGVPRSIGAESIIDGVFTVGVAVERQMIVAVLFVADKDFGVVAAGPLILGRNLVGFQFADIGGAESDVERFAVVDDFDFGGQLVGFIGFAHFGHGFDFARLGPDTGIEIKVLHNGETLYVGVRSPFVGNLEANKVSPKDKWPSGDHAEIFISNEKDGYYHLAFNCYANGENGIYDAMGTNASWNTKWEAFSQIKDGEWRGVAVIPLKSVNIKVEQNNKVRALFYRVHPKRGDIKGSNTQHSTWAGGQVHSASSFGQLVFLHE